MSDRVYRVSVQATTALQNLGANIRRVFAFPNGVKFFFELFLVLLHKLFWQLKMVGKRMNFGLFSKDSIRDFHRDAHPEKRVQHCDPLTRTGMLIDPETGWGIPAAPWSRPNR